MKICKDCVHYAVCNMYDGPYISVHFNHSCKYFTDKSRIIELPCNVGDSVFYVHRNSQGNNYVLKASVSGVVTAIYENVNKIYLKIIYEDIDGHTDWATAIYGISAFSSREEAVARLKELAGNE